MTRELVYCRFPLVDGPGNPPWLLRAAVETVAGLLRDDVPTLVGCGAGLSRSPCIAGAAIARIRSCPADEGLAIALGSAPADVSPGALGRRPPDRRLTTALGRRILVEGGQDPMVEAIHPAIR